MTNQFFVSIHIPKTAGTTLGTVFNRVFRYRLFMDYADYDHYETPDPLIVENRAFIETYFEGIHGHFSARRYLGVFRSAKFIACVRHPVDRIISQYLHELNEGGPRSLYHDDLASGRMSVVDFAGQEGVGNAMSRHLSGIELQQYDLLLLTERLPQSMHLLNRIIGNLSLERHFGKPPVFPSENQAAARAIRMEFDENTRREIFLRAPRDVEVYRKAQELLNQRLLNIM